MTSNKVVNVAAGVSATDAANVGQLKFNFVQEATPTGTVVGQTWFATGLGRSFVWYDSFWVEF